MEIRGKPPPYLFLTHKIFYLYHILRIWKLFLHTLCYRHCIQTLVVITPWRNFEPLKQIKAIPFLVLCPVLFFVPCTYVWWFLHGGDVSLFMWYICCMLCLLPILSEHGLCALMENWSNICKTYDFVCLTSDSLTTFDMAEPIMLSLVLLLWKINNTFNLNPANLYSNT